MYNSELDKWISIHSTRVGGDPPERVYQAMVRISIHSTRVGGDKYTDADGNGYSNISIHSARVGGDICGAIAHLC